MSIDSWFAVAFFFITITGLGYSIFWLFKTKLHDNTLIAILETLAIGLATFSFLGIILDVLHIPLHYSVYLVLALICPLIEAIMALLGKRTKRVDVQFNIPLKSKETISVFILILILAFYFAFFLKGATSYQYLEDDDPWQHALGSAYIGRTYTYDLGPSGANGYGYYLEPYPPTYDTIMGVTWQVGKDMPLILKLFNVIIMTFALGACYLLAKALLHSDFKALFATIILAALPSFMSHFIWSQTLGLALLPIAFYAVIRGLNDTSWRLPAIIAVASVLVSQPVVSAIFGIMMLVMIALIFAHELTQHAQPQQYPSQEDASSSADVSSTNGKKQTRKKSANNADVKSGRGSQSSTSSLPFLDRIPMTVQGFIIGACGFALSFVFYAQQFIKWGFTGVIKGHGGGFTSWDPTYVFQKYSFSEVFSPPMSSRIDQAIGWGPIITLLVILGVVAIFIAWKRTMVISRSWTHWFMIIWFIGMMHLVFGPTLGLPSFGTSRAWPYLAIPLAIVVAEGTFIIVNTLIKTMTKKQAQQGLLMVVCLIVLAAGIVYTSFPAKAAVQQAQWPPGAHWGAAQYEIPGYLAMRETLPLNTRVYTFCEHQRGIGFGMQSDPWNPEEYDFRKKSMNLTGEEIVGFLKAHNYSYFTIDVSCVNAWGENATQQVVGELSSTGKIQPVISQQGFLLASII